MKVAVGYFLSRFTRQAVVFGYPSSISIEPTTSCNLRCPECPSGLRSFNRPTGMLDESFFKEITDQLYRHVLYLVFYFQGEPFLNPKFFEMIRHASSRKIYTATSTNAHFLSDETAKETVESGLDRLIISIDGTTQNVYSEYRIGGSLEKVLEGARNIVSWKKKLNSSRPYLVFQFLVVRPNEHQVDDAKKLAKEIGVDTIVFKTAQIYDYQNGNSLIPLTEKYSRYKKSSEGTFVLKNKMLNHCWKLWKTSVITWDGKIVPCCFDKDAKYPMGSLTEKKFISIWKGELYNRFRESVLKSRKENDICSNCTEGTKVWS
jgi:radical SAM protein with 4Fe4S-binding SPASM domain